VVSGILAPQAEPRVSRAAGFPGAAGGFTTGASLPIASSPTRPSRHTAVTAVDDAAGPFTPPAPAGDPPPRPRSFHEFADEFGERLQAAASELGLLGER
jgi:hypothetical protein